MGRGSGGLIVPTSDGVGIIEAFGGVDVPSGYLACDGALVSKAVYSRLYAAWGPNRWGTDTATHFYLPDGRSGFLVGAGTGTKFTVNTNRSVGDYDDDSMQGHKHTTDIQYTNADDGAGNGTLINSLTINGSISKPSGGPVELDNGTPRTGTETKPNSLAVKFIVRHAPRSGVVLGYNIPNPVMTTSTTQTLTSMQIKTYNLIAVTTGSSANVVLTLPPMDEWINYRLKVQKADSGTKFIQIAPNSTENIRGSNTSIYCIAQNETIELLNTGSEILILSDPLRTVCAYITNSGTPTTQTVIGGDWVQNLTDNGTGSVTINFNSGVFSSAPYGTGNPRNTTDSFLVFGGNPTTSNSGIIYTTKTDNNQYDRNFMVTFVGPK